MNYCNWKDIVRKIIRKFPPDLGSLPEGCEFVLGEPKGEHSLSGWFSIGLEVKQQQESWMILSGLAPTKSYTPFWDVYGDEMLLKEELKKACDWLGGVYSTKDLKTRQLEYEMGRFGPTGHIDFENSKRSKHV